MTVYQVCARCRQTWYFIAGREYRRSPCCGKELVPSTQRLPHD